MFQKFAAKVRRWAELPAHDVLNLLSWLQRSKSEFKYDNPNVLVEKACDERGEPVVYLTAEPVYIMGGIAIRPGTDPSQAEDAGDLVDSAFLHEAEKAGVQRVFVVLPDTAPFHPQEQCLRVIERKLPQRTIVTISTADGPIEKKLSINTATQTAEWFN